MLVECWRPTGVDKSCMVVKWFFFLGGGGKAKGLNESDLLSTVPSQQKRHCLDQVNACDACKVHMSCPGPELVLG